MTPLQCLSASGRLQSHTNSIAKRGNLTCNGIRRKTPVLNHA
ncbi:hypothetical protein LMG27177_03694 [Paraburkholderia fynbosensis]|uniref:Uncharacterized protein n=1 Tax=Paraburkholderia fynbosensis TaxID=1200993 RepID=A0A6J5G6F9_9BURK|nr:hypothetical protein LMG27177_03694 [Paraburkholderia fynbosensis]